MTDITVAGEAYMLNPGISEHPRKWESQAFTFQRTLRAGGLFRKQLGDPPTIRTTFKW